MRSKLTKIGLILAVVIMPSVGKAATEAAEFEISANVAITSDYVWRGVSQTNEDPAIQGGFDISHKSGLYLGVWASNIDFGDAQMEMDFYAGFAQDFKNGLDIDLGVIRYAYPGSPGSKEYDFTELYVGLGYSVAKLGLSAKFSHSPDFTGSLTNESAQYIEAGIEYSLPEDFTLAAHYGHSFGNAFSTPSSYDDYSVGISKSLFGLGFDISYYGTNNNGKTLFAANADDRFVFSVSKTF